MESWEVRHQKWREAGNQCLECERLERSVDSAHENLAKRISRAIAGSDRWSWIQPTVLPGGPRDDARGSRSWQSGPDPAPEPRDPRSLEELRRTAEKLELKIAGNNIRGPAQNRPIWEAEQERLEAECRATWAAWSRKLEESSG